MLLQSICLSIGEISIAINSDDDQFIDDVAQYYQNFLSDQKDANYALNIIHQNFPTKDEINVSKERDIYHIDGGEFVAQFDASQNQINATLRAEKSVLDSLLRVLYSIILTSHNGFLVHSAGLKKEAGAYLFVGKSEAGKSTTAKNATEFDVLNDELTLVRKIDGQFCLFATPFNGDYEGEIQNSQAILKGIFFLDKQLDASLIGVKKSDALVQFLENVFFFDPDVLNNQTILSLSHELVLNYDICCINVLAHKSLWGIIHEHTKECSLA